MSASSHTPNLGLSQFVGSDPFEMSDFNADNAALDAAVAAKAEIAVGSYVGTGESDSSHPVTLTFSKPPKLVFINEDAHLPVMAQPAVLIRGMEHSNPARSTGGTSATAITISWDNNSVSFYAQSGSPEDQLNKNGVTYFYAAIC
ncbi:MAG: hypothetical protein IJR65_05790 [Oscillospiraceae bacterium]|nr:hypothetical protein [Oscillospiraceae bacterium]